MVGAKKDGLQSQEEDQNTWGPFLLAVGSGTPASVQNQCDLKGPGNNHGCAWWLSHKNANLIIILILISVYLM